jgi:hypothetical protein
VSSFTAFILAQRLTVLAEERRCVMLPFRDELQTYSRICETLLSSTLEPELTEEEQDLIIYYANELFEKYAHQRNGHARFA